MSNQKYIKKVSAKKMGRQPELMEVRHATSFAYHLADGKGNILCGSEGCLAPHRATTVSAIVASIPKQHTNWFWCNVCVNKATGVSFQEVFEGFNMD